MRFVMLTSPRNALRTTVRTVALIGVVASTSVITSLPAAADDAALCAALSAPVYQHIDPASQASTLSTSAAIQGSFTTDNGVLFEAATQSSTGLVEVRQLRAPSTGNHVYIAAGNEANNAVTKYGYVDDGTAFYASPTSLSCTVPVYRVRLRAIHRAVVDSAARQELIDAGWLAEGISYYAVAPGTVPAPPPPPTGPQLPAPHSIPDRPGDTTFSIAVMPDTQQEVFAPDGRFRNRSQWLVDHAGPDDLDLRFVTHTGDVMNWDTPTHDQYAWASQALQPLQDAGIPWSLSNGNHDNEATGVGGSARDPNNTRTLLRDTSTWNSYFTADRYGDVGGWFEPGKTDNIYSEFTAGGVHWMVLNLELWPRTAVVDWAKQVVANHPSDNVIVSTHSYLNADGSIYQGADYGATSPQYLFDNLIKVYPNIKMVFSGHVGVSATRVDYGISGNKIFSVLTAIHSLSTNPVRLVQIDTAAGSINLKIRAPWDNATDWFYADSTQTGLQVVT